MGILARGLQGLPLCWGAAYSAGLLFLGNVHHSSILLLYTTLKGPNLYRPLGHTGKLFLAKVDIRNRCPLGYIDC